ncbi:MAG: hypothetical protein IPJ06_12740 [Saprospiraceae bacterium]|nr:hypothetical protein [Saprospiraceae bacterium]
MNRSTELDQTWRKEHPFAPLSIHGEGLGPSRWPRALGVIVWIWTFRF